MNEQSCYVIKKNPGSTSSPWLMQMSQNYGGRLCYGSLSDLIFRSESVVLKTFRTVGEAREFIREDQEKSVNDQMCYSDSLICKFEVFSDSVKITTDSLW